MSNNSQKPPLVVHHVAEPVTVKLKGKGTATLPTTSKTANSAR